MPGLLKTIFDTYLSNQQGWKADAEKRREEDRRKAELALRTMPDSTSPEVLRPLLEAVMGKDKAAAVLMAQGRAREMDAAEKARKDQAALREDQLRNVGGLQSTIENFRTDNAPEYLDAMLNQPDAEQTYGVKNPGAYGPPASPLIQSLRNIAGARQGDIRQARTDDAANQVWTEKKRGWEEQDRARSLTNTPAEDLGLYNHYLNFWEAKFPRDPDTGEDDPRAQEYANKYYKMKANVETMNRDWTEYLNGPEAQGEMLFEKHGDNQMAALQDIQRSKMGPGEGPAVMAAYLRFVQNDPKRRTKPKPAVVSPAELAPVKPTPAISLMAPLGLGSATSTPIAIDLMGALKKSYAEPEYRKKQRKAYAEKVKTIRGY
ncbi:MAG: hypothetical protein AAB538_06175 [Patescibacteria group bacterium]